MPASGIGNAGNLLTTAADAAHALWKSVFAWRRDASRQKERICHVGSARRHHDTGKHYAK
jgi:hypothetical protein